MNTNTADAPTPAAPRPLPDTARLVATFPLNGREGSGYAVWFVDETTELEHFEITDHYRTRYAIAQRPTIAAAVAYCLRGSGWGSFKFQELEQ